MVAKQPHPITEAIVKDSNFFIVAQEHSATAKDLESLKPDSN
jgi:hypothetical protein